MPHTDLITTERPGWQQQLRDAVSSSEQLLELLQLEPAQVPVAAAAAEQFPLRVPHSFISRMTVGDANDPLLRQVLAVPEELVETPGYGSDPVGERGSANPSPGIIHKYDGRVLLITTGACAINCRYCFRRHFPYADNQNSRFHWRETLQHVRDDASISEVILSGGDPLVATDRQLAELVGLIAAIPHVQRLRIHSRLPIVLPDRVTPELVKAICHPRLQTIMVVHSNHAREIDDTVRAGMARLQRSGITLLNQAVLLAGINDDSDSLAELCAALFSSGIMPYYLHLLDKVRGAAHFDVPESRGLELMHSLSARLPGYMVPRLVREIAGEPGKTRIY